MSVVFADYATVYRIILRPVKGKAFNHVNNQRVGPLTIFGAALTKG
jgi:hypothetical protein